VIAGLSLDPLYRAVGWLLAVFYSIPPHSLGVSIIVLTIVVMAVQFPLIRTQTRSMIQMQRVQPELKKIQQKYKDDRQKQNEELLKFYQENKINPAAGCLPLLITLPIGLAVFRTFREGVQKHLPKTGAFDRLYTDICTIHGHYYASTADCTKALGGKSPVGAPLTAHYTKGQTPPTFRFLGMNLNWSAREVQTQLSGEYLHWIPYFLLIGLVILSGWYQVRQTQARQLKQGGAPANAQMQTLTKIFPIFFGFISYGLNAATTIYFFISNAWRIGQQHFVLNKMYEEGFGQGASGSAPAKPKPIPDNGSNGNAKKPPVDEAADAESPQNRQPNRRKQRKKR
jgi:YidC/Oxa1 family membrane protein insertase